jgi:hypothetical protein
MVELQRSWASRVTAIDASSSVRVDQVELPLTAPFSKRPPKLLAPTLAPLSLRLLRRPETEWNSRGVVVAEGRALETKAAPVERAQLSVDHKLRRKLSSAGYADERLRRAYDRFSRSLERGMRSAAEATFPAAEIASPTIDHDHRGELRTAAQTYQHARDRT